MNLLIEHIRNEVSISEEEAEIILSAFVSKKLKKKENLLFKGDISSHMRFVESGCLRSYYIDDQGHERILQFGIEGWWVNDLYSYLTRTPAQLFVQALEPTTVLQIHKERLNTLFDEVPMMERFFRYKIQNAYVALQNRTIDAMSETAESRYTEFRKAYRSIEQRVPQYMIASYLGITPEHLSSIRKKLQDSFS